MNSPLQIHWDKAELDKDIAWLEQPKRLSESALWSFQEDFYQASGVTAWTADNMVPMFITNNPLLAQHYARLVIAFIQDNLAQLDTNAPINIIEIGSGAGRFTFLMLQELTRLKAYFPDIDALHIRVVLTDFSDKLVGYWLDNPQLQPFLEKGTLDVATYNPIEDTQIKLVRSGDLLTPETMLNPCLVMANYYFDTIPHDLFVISPDERIQELLVSPCIKPGSERPFKLEHLELLLEPRDISFPYYKDRPHWDSLLKIYDEAFRPGSDIILPIGAFNTIEALGKLSPRGVAIITTDKGTLADPYMFLRSKQHTDIVGPLPPVFGILLHGDGAFSVNVNFHALKEYALVRGGRSFNTDQFNSFVHTAFLWLPGDTDEPWQLNNCQYHFYEDLTRYNSINSFIRLGALYDESDSEKMGRYPALASLMALFQTSNYDPYLLKFFARYMYDFGEFNLFEGLELEMHLDKMIKNQYTIQQTDNCGLLFGYYYRKINRPHKAIDAMQQSLKLFPANDEILAMLALCYSDTGNYTAAIDYTRQALNMVEATTQDESTMTTLASRIEMWQEILVRA